MYFLFKNLFQNNAEGSFVYIFSIMLALSSIFFTEQLSIINIYQFMFCNIIFMMLVKRFLSIHFKQLENNAKPKKKAFSLFLRTGSSQENGVLVIGVAFSLFYLFKGGDFINFIEIYVMTVVLSALLIAPEMPSIARRFITLDEFKSWFSLDEVSVWLMLILCMIFCSVGLYFIEAELTNLWIVLVASHITIMLFNTWWFKPLLSKLNYKNVS